MEKRSILEIKTENHHLFLQQGFFDVSAHTSKMHFHGYTEIHIIVGGEITYFIDGQVYTFKAGDILSIPKKTYHHCLNLNDDAQSIAFQTEKNIDGIRSTSISLPLLLDFVEEIKKAKQSNDYNVILKYISLCSALLMNEKIVNPVETVDYLFVISEFFSNQYNQKVTIQTLANELRLSEKQTARLVKKYTGNTFNQQLTLSRLNVANYLINSTDMTMTEIAEYVGFESYSGFWKASKKQNIKSSKTL